MSIPAASLFQVCSLCVFLSKLKRLFFPTCWIWETFFIFLPFFFGFMLTTLMNKERYNQTLISESLIFPSVLLSDCFPQDYITCQLPFLGITAPCPARVLTRRLFAQHQALQPGSECLGREYTRCSSESLF